jgi:phosphotransferase system HPr-like phosphotransfer protein
MGDTITIHVQGADAEEALEKLAGLIESRFGED